jgi:hypothetical protein
MNIVLTQRTDWTPFGGETVEIFCSNLDMAYVVEDTIYTNWFIWAYEQALALFANHSGRVIGHGGTVLLFVDEELN